MGKHSKNKYRCAGSVYTYYERQLDGKKYGTLQQRIGKDSVKDFDCCWLTLQPCKDPVITEHGYLYDKEAILEYILHQKVENARKLKLYEEDLARTQSKSAEAESKSSKKVVDDFVKQQNSVASDLAPFKANSSEAGPSDTDVPNRNKWDPNQTKLRQNFWIPENTPSAKDAVLTKPDQNVYCPISGKKLKIKDLLPVTFKLIDDSSSANLAAKKERYMCPLTFETLTNATPCAYLKSSGYVVTMGAVNNIIKKDMVDPFTSKPITESDIVPIARGGTGFAGAGVDLAPKKYTPALQV